MSGYAMPSGLVSLGSVLPILGFIAVALQFYTRKAQKAPLMADDWLIVPLILLIGMGVILIVGVKGHGEGYKVPASALDSLQTLSPEETLTDKTEFVITILQPAQVGFHFMNYATLITIVLVIIWTIAFVLVNTFDCGIHFTNNWGNFANLISQCVDITSMNEAWAGSDFAMDMIILMMPMPIVWRLQMPISKRFAVIATLALGALTVIASIIRLIITVLLTNLVSSALLSQDPDILVSTILFWTVLEGGLATTVACLPTLSYFIQKFPDMSKSVRSMFSIVSSMKSKRISKSSDITSTSSGTKVLETDFQSRPGSETYAVKDLESQKPHMHDSVRVDSFSEME